MGDAAQTVATGNEARAWVMQSADLDSQDGTINGKKPGIDEAGELTGLSGQAAKDALSMPGKAIAFVAVPGAGNPACS